MLAIPETRSLSSLFKSPLGSSIGAASTGLVTDWCYTLGVSNECDFKGASGKRGVTMLSSSDSMLGEEWSTPIFDSVAFITSTPF
jgi:hypothetical protein